MSWLTAESLPVIGRDLGAVAPLSRPLSPVETQRPSFFRSAVRPSPVSVLWFWTRFLMISCISSLLFWSFSVWFRWSKSWHVSCCLPVLTLCWDCWELWWETLVFTGPSAASQDVLFLACLLIGRRLQSARSVWHDASYLTWATAKAFIHASDWTATVRDKRWVISK